MSGSKGIHRVRGGPARRRKAVSDIVATILAVAVTVVLAAVLYVLVSGLSHAPGTTPIGSAFAVGAPRAGSCTAAGPGCLAGGDFIETLKIDQSTVTFASVLFEVTTSSGTVWKCGTGGSGSGAGVTCGFSVVTDSGTDAAISATFAAGAGMVMSGGFATFTGVSGGSSLTSGVYQIVIDMSGKGMTEMDLSFTVIGQGSYAGTTEPVPLA